MADYETYPTAPNLGKAFNTHKAAKQQPSPTAGDPGDTLDHLDRSEWALTPGGSLEQVVHTQISQQGRAAYREAMRSQQEPSHEAQYRRQMADEFERAVNQQAEEHDAEHAHDDPATQAIVSPESETPEKSDLELSPAELKASIDKQLNALTPTFGSVSPQRTFDGPSR